MSGNLIEFITTMVTILGDEEVTFKHKQSVDVRTDDIVLILAVLIAFLVMSHEEYEHLGFKEQA